MAPPGYVEIRLVPVQVFGTDTCCEHGDPAPPDCPSSGYGLSDAVSSWSDCNRAEGRIYRVDETDPQYREPGETMTVLVKIEDLPWFEKRWGDI